MATHPPPQRWLAAVTDYRWQLAPLAVLMIVGWFGPGFFSRFVSIGTSASLWAATSGLGTAIVTFGLLRAWNRLDPHTRALWGICLATLATKFLSALITSISVAIYTFPPFELLSMLRLGLLSLLLTSLAVGWIASRLTPLGLRSVLFVLMAYVALQTTATPSVLYNVLLVLMGVQLVVWLIVAMATKRFPERSDDAQKATLAVLAALPVPVAVGKSAILAFGGSTLVPAWSLSTDAWLPLWLVHPVEAVGLALFTAAAWWLFRAGQQGSTRASGRG